MVRSTNFKKLLWVQAKSPNGRKIMKGWRTGVGFDILIKISLFDNLSFIIYNDAKTDFYVKIRLIIY